MLSMIQRAWMGALLLAMWSAMTSPLQAQQELLPKGIGLYQFGYRPYLDIHSKYDSAGGTVSLGEPFNKSFSGTGLLEGAGGADLKKLADQLRRFDSFANTADGLIQSLNLGEMTGEVHAKIDAKIFALAYGVNEHLTLFSGIPWVTASVDTDIQFHGNNNAQAIKARLGAAAFQELQSGLDQASRLTTAQIKQSIEDKGYAPIEHWETSGLGDIRIGALLGRETGLGRGRRSLQSWRSTVMLPTGYQDDADILTDVGIGKGYYSWLNEGSQRIVWRNGMWLGARAGYGLNLPATVERRVPEGDEGIIAADRKADVHLSPGGDLSGGGIVGYAPGALKFNYELGVNMHMKDAYSGPLEGNYAKLAEGSDAQVLFHVTSIQLQTAELYKRKKFPIPVIIDAKFYMPLAGKNATQERYFEISLASFFQTPAADTKISRSSARGKRMHAH